MTTASIQQVLCYDSSGQMYSFISSSRQPRRQGKSPISQVRILKFRVGKGLVGGADPSGTDPQSQSLAGASGEEAARQREEGLCTGPICQLHQYSFI